MEGPGHLGPEVSLEEGTQLTPCSAPVSRLCLRNSVAQTLAGSQISSPAPEIRLHMNNS